MVNALKGDIETDSRTSSGIVSYDWRNSCLLADIAWFP